MALRGASTTVDQDWIDWEALALEGAAVVCTVREIEQPKDYGNGEVAAVRARVIVLTGKHAGSVYPDERILKKGIRMKLENVGDDVVGRLAIYGTRKAVGLNAEQEGDIELAEKALAKASGKAVPAQASAPAEEEPPF
jgi:hypothetical protein